MLFRCPVLLLLFLAAPAAAQSDLTGVWRVAEIGEWQGGAAALGAEPKYEARFHQGAFTVRLSCTALQGRYGPLGIETGSVTAEATGCPADEAGRADALLRLTDDPGTVQAVVEGDLFLTGPNGLHARLARIPGTAGPADPALGDRSMGMLGRWRIETIDGRAPGPGVRFGPHALS